VSSVEAVQVRETVTEGRARRGCRYGGRAGVSGRLTVKRAALEVAEKTELRYHEIVDARRRRDRFSSAARMEYVAPWLTRSGGRSLASGRSVRRTADAAVKVVD